MFARSAKSSRCLTYFIQYLKFSSSSQKFEESMANVIKTKNYHQIADLLGSSKESCHNPNPFSFLSSFSHDQRTTIIDEILQSFILIRPRARPNIAYTCLLSYSLQSLNPLPLSFAILQRTLRSGCIPVPQTHLLLSNAWLARRSESHSVSSLLMDMQSIGYNPDTGTCNYLISSLCAIDHIAEAVEVLKDMSKAGCAPDLETFNTIISAMCVIRNTAGSIEILQEMVTKYRLTPRQGTVKKLASALRANKEIWKAVEVIEFLEKEGFCVGFETFEAVVDGCLECREFVLAGKVVMKMTGRGFIPYIRVRLKVIEGLVGVGENELACIVRKMFTELKS